MSNSFDFPRDPGFYNPPQRGRIRGFLIGVPIGALGLYLLQQLF